MSRQWFKIFCFQVINLIFLLSGSVGGSFVVVDASIFLVCFLFLCGIFWGGRDCGVFDWFGGLLI